MADVMGVIDPIPDNDSFLPRYLTVQLIEILAATFGDKNSAALNLSTQGSKFIETFKNKEFFSPLTYSIFWHENIESVLNTTEDINAPDKYNFAPLTLALANEDFNLALTLIRKGAIILLEDKLVLEIALTSMLQRNPDTLSKILATQIKHDTSWVKDYLDYLNSYITGIPAPPPTKYHEILNPLIRHFGQVLDTLAYFNGFPSSYGFLSPSIEILSAHMPLYVEDLLDARSKKLFNEIAAAFNFTRETCKYYGNFATTENAASILANQIATNSNGKGVIVLFGGFAGNSVAIAFINKFMVLSNLGIGGNPTAGTKIYNIINPTAINSELINTFMQGLGNATDPQIVLNLLGNVVDANPIFTIKQSVTTLDNCIFVNPRAVIEGILLVLSVLEKQQSITADALNAEANNIHNQYLDYVDSLYKYSAADLASFMRNSDILQNRRIECCALAIDYINQHYTDPRSLQRCIELKNALEFVGLKNFYLNDVIPEAQAAIQQLIIQQQEAVALQVIELENSMSFSLPEQQKQEGAQ